MIAVRRTARQGDALVETAGRPPERDEAHTASLVAGGAGSRGRRSKARRLGPSAAVSTRRVLAHGAGARRNGVLRTPSNIRPRLPLASRR